MGERIQHRVLENPSNCQVFYVAHHDPGMILLINYGDKSQTSMEIYLAFLAFLLGLASPWSVSSLFRFFSFLSFFSSVFPLLGFLVLSPFESLVSSSLESFLAFLVGLSVADFVQNFLKFLMPAALQTK